MIECLLTSERMSKIIKQNDVVDLCGQVGAGDSVTAKTQDYLARVDAPLIEAVRIANTSCKPSTGWQIWSTLPRLMPFGTPGCLQAMRPHGPVARRNWRAMC